MDARVKPEHDGFFRLAARSQEYVTLGLDPRVPSFPNSGMGGWVYIVTNRRHGTLYVGVTSDIRRRTWEHREGVADGFSKRYGLKRLVHLEFHEDITAAIQREKTVKRWLRAWKIALIERDNPEWADLYETLNE